MSDKKTTKKRDTERKPGRTTDNRVRDFILAHITVTEMQSIAIGSATPALKLRADLHFTKCVLCESLRDFLEGEQTVLTKEIEVTPADVERARVVMRRLNAEEAKRKKA